MKVHAIPCLSDNYSFVIEPSQECRGTPTQESQAWQAQTYDTQTASVLVVDACEAKPLMQFFEQHAFRPEVILTTHHHHDHVGANSELQRKFKCSVYARFPDSEQVPALSSRLDVEDTESFMTWRGIEIFALAIPGHTLGHTAYWFKNENTLFVGDTLFRFGCGRLFEGSYGQLFSSLKKLADLPDETTVYCGHEYALRNLDFCEKHKLIADGNTQRKKVEEQINSTGSSVPFLLSDQKQVNPFLTAKTVEDFTQLRKLRDRF